MLERCKAFQHDGATASNRSPVLDADRRGVHGLRRKDAARALRAAGQALAGGVLARAPDAGARLDRRAGGGAQDARAADLALALRARRARLRRDDQRVEGAARAARAAFHARAPRGGGRAGLGRRDAQMAAAAAPRTVWAGRTD